MSDVAENTASPGAVEEGVSLWQDAFRRLKKNKLACFGVVFLSIEAIICLGLPATNWILAQMGIGPLFPLDYMSQDLDLWLDPPSAKYWFGTDTLGRDLFSRVVVGGCVSLSVGIISSLVSVVVGVIYGAISGFVGGKVDSWMMRTVDVLYALPYVVLVIILMVYFGRNIILLFVALGLTQWLTMARITRGQVISIKEKEFVEAAESMGSKKRSIIFKHLIPNSLGPVIIYLTLTVPSVMLEEAFLSFLGLGVQAPLASWGTLIADGVKSMEDRATVLFFPAAALAMTLFALNFLGDGLRDALDPKRSKD